MDGKQQKVDWQESGRRGIRKKQRWLNGDGEKNEEEERDEEEEEEEGDDEEEEEGKEGKITKQMMNEQI